MINAAIDRAPLQRASRNFRSETERRVERAALIASDQASRIAVRSIREAMAGAGLGRLGNALGQGSDLSHGNGVHRSGSRISASGWVVIRAGSPRSRGAIEAYTEGANIRPVRGRWLWIPSPEIARIAGPRGARERVTPENWERLGLARRFGPLVPLKSIDGRPLLAVERVGSAEGKPGLTSLTKSGRARKGQRRRDIVVAFVAIPVTSRAARVDVPALMRAASAQMPALFDAAVSRKASSPSSRATPIPLALRWISSTRSSRISRTPSRRLARRLL